MQKNWKLKNKLITISIILLFILSIGNSLGVNIIKNRDPKQNFEWDALINFTETGGDNDIIIFGESYNASDGVDLYDAPNPPAGFPPFLDAFITTNFPWPHDALLQEIKAYPDVYKIWNITISIPGNLTGTIL